MIDTASRVYQLIVYSVWITWRLVNRRIWLHPCLTVREGITSKYKHTKWWVWYWSSSAPLSPCLLFLFLLVIVLIVAVGDLLRSLREEMGGLDLTDGAGQLVSLALDLLQVDIMAVPCGQRWFCVDDVDVGVIHCRLMRHLVGGRGGGSGTIFLCCITPWLPKKKTCDDQLSEHSPVRVQLWTGSWMGNRAG